MTTDIDTSICAGESFAGYTETGMYSDTLVDSEGLDSIVNIDLTVIPAVFSSITDTICQGETFAGYSFSGEYRDTIVALSCLLYNTDAADDLMPSSPVSFHVL